MGRGLYFNAALIEKPPEPFCFYAFLYLVILDIPVPSRSYCCTMLLLYNSTASHVAVKKGVSEHRGESLPT